MARTLTIKLPCLKGVPMPSPINELSVPEPTEASPATPMEVSKARLANGKLDENGDVCELGFADQCKIVWEGAKRGFTYDGCTGVPDFSFGSDCCGEHDYHYQLRDISKWEADKRLRECILKKGYPLIAWTYWLGVSTLGWLFWRKKQNEIFPLADNSDPRA